MVRTLPTFLMKKAKQQVPFPLESGWKAQLPTSSQTYYKVTFIYSIPHNSLSEHGWNKIPGRLKIHTLLHYLYTEHLTPRPHPLSSLIIASSHDVAGVRLSGYFLNAVMWYASVTNATQYNSNTTVLDSQINGTINYTPPVLNVRWEMSSGEFCPTQVQNVLNF